MGRQRWWRQRVSRPGFMQKQDERLQKTVGGRFVSYILKMHHIKMGTPEVVVLRLL